MNRVLGLSKKERAPLTYNPVTKEAYDGVKHLQQRKQTLINGVRPAHIQVSTYPLNKKKIKH
jgi:hypothetical protein